MVVRLYTRILFLKEKCFPELFTCGYLRQRIKYSVARPINTSSLWDFLTLDCADLKLLKNYKKIKYSECAKLMSTCRSVFVCNLIYCCCHFSTSLAVIIFALDSLPDGLGWMDRWLNFGSMTSTIFFPPSLFFLLSGIFLVSSVS